jgi:phosphatidyl-myo-inositol dimannoside synthase
MPEKILLLSLETFHAAGGIQRMSRTLAYSLHQLSRKNSWQMDLYTLNDKRTDVMPQYLPRENFKAFNKNKVTFVLDSIKAGRKAHLIILTHINLSLIGWMIYLLNPKCQIWLIAHGIEVWRPLKLWKKSILKICDQVICVSRYTRNKIIELHHANPDRSLVLNNVLDPFIKLPLLFDKPESLLERYHLNADHKIILTLTRIAATEQFKGYEQVIKAISSIKYSVPDIKYMLAGPYDEPEKFRIQQMIAAYNLEDNFILTGFIKEEELADHFLLADLFVLPSKKEGFGIVFIEAMAFGLPVICGNADGSIDAVRNKEMGTAIDPDDMNELEQAIRSRLNHPLSTNERKHIQHQCLQYFNEQDYRNTLENQIKDDGAIA